MNRFSRRNTRIVTSPDVRPMWMHGRRGPFKLEITAVVTLSNAGLGRLNARVVDGVDEDRDREIAQVAANER